MNSLLEIITGSNIAKDNFKNYVDSCSIINFSDIEKYYKTKKAHADSLVLEDEFVGLTYQNLEVLNNVILKRTFK